MLHLFICVFILEKYTLLKSLALVILHHNHSLLTRYDFLPFMYCLVVPKNLGFPKNKKKQKKIKTKQKKQFSRGLCTWGFCRKSFEILCFFYFFGFIVFFCFFWFFGNPRFFGTTKFPNLWKIVFFGISEYSKHLVLSEMSLSVAKVTEKHLQIIVSIWCKISRKKHMQINGKPHSQGHPFWNLT